MTDIVAQWETVAEGFTARLDAVSDEQWERSTPCSEWNVRQLVEHAVGAQALVPNELGVGLPGDGDPAGWPKLREAALEEYRKPGALEKTVKMPFGEVPAEMGLGIALGDMLIHSWDLARATGGDERLDQEAVASVYESLKPMDAMLRGPGIMGPKLDAPSGSDLQTEFLCFTGRRP